MPSVGVPDSSYYYDEAIAKAYNRAFASDYIIIGLLLSCIFPWVTFVCCAVASVYLRVRSDPRCARTMSMLNESLTRNVGAPFADLVAPVQAEIVTKWVQTANGHVPVVDGGGHRV